MPVAGRILDISDDQALNAPIIILDVFHISTH